jgi:hypothetical protein
VKGHIEVVSQGAARLRTPTRPGKPGLDPRRVPWVEPGGPLMSANPTFGGLAVFGGPVK